MEEQKMVCPECGSDKVATILYGLITFEPENFPERYNMGGCEVFDDSPLYHCDDCHHEWGRYADK